jgi:hypothetical protein
VLVARTVRFREAPRPERLEALAAAAVEVLNGELPVVVDPRAHADVALVVEHARALAFAPATRQEAELLGWVARYDRGRGDYASAERSYRRRREALVSLLGEEHPGTLAAKRGPRAAGAGAGSIAEPALEASRRLLGEEHPVTLGAMVTLAATLGHQGDWRAPAH